jgi:hypothetical protein
MDTLFPLGRLSAVCRSSTWSLKTPDNSLIHFSLERQGKGNWKAYADEVEAALSLWLFSVDEKENRKTYQQLLRLSKDDTWLRSKGTTAKDSLRLLGQYTHALNRDLEWWMPNDS